MSRSIFDLNNHQYNERKEEYDKSFRKAYSINKKVQKYYKKINKIKVKLAKIYGVLND